MKKIIECVPNFSEGRNPEIIEAIAKAIRDTEGVNLMDVDPGKSTNRTVYTFAGDEKTVIEGALNAARVAKELIDMRQHKGEHPRMGAMDVCPFIPVANVTMEECVNVSKEFAKRASEELGITIYLYEYSQEKEYRKSLPEIRKGEYEAMAEKVQKNDWIPDFWNGKFDPSWGASVVGARDFLIAYNINVLAPYNQAHRIALNLREAGRGNGDYGLLKSTKAIGWEVKEYGLAQISMNLNDFNVTPIHFAFEAAKVEAEKLKVALSGSEIVGLVPLKAILDAAEYYIEKEALFILEESQKIKLVIDRLGLNSISQFIPEKRIIEYIIAEKRDEPLASLSVRDFILEVAARTSAPGGGSVSALISALGVALGKMVAHLTYGVRKFEDVSDKMKLALPNLKKVSEELIPKIDEDTNAFNDYLVAVRLPQDTEEEKSHRDKELQKGLKKAIISPLSVMRLANSAWDEMILAAKYGNIASRSDIEVGGFALYLGIWGSERNVKINMVEIKDEIWKKEVLEEVEIIINNSKEKFDLLLKSLEDRDGKY